MSQIDFFSRFPKINYPYKGKMVKDGESFAVTGVECSDISIRFKFRDKLKTNPLTFFPYDWEDGDRPDIIAQAYYGDEKYAWVVLMSAEVYDWIHELPFTDEELRQYLEDYYVGETIEGTPVNTVDDLQSIVHHYEDGDGYIIDLDTYTAISDPGKKIVTIYEFEFLQNEDRRRIKLIDKKYLSQIISEFEDLMISIKKFRKKYPVNFSQSEL